MVQENSRAEVMLNSKHAKQYLPNGIIKVVRCWDSVANRICQEPEFVSNFVYTLASVSWARVCLLWLSLSSITLIESGEVHANSYPPIRFCGELGSYSQARCDWTSLISCLWDTRELANAGHLQKQSVWWPGLSAQLRELVRKCRSCSQHQTQRAEPLVSSSLPQLP